MESILCFPYWRQGPGALSLPGWDSTSPLNSCIHDIPPGSTLKGIKCVQTVPGPPTPPLLLLPPLLSLIILLKGSPGIFIHCPGTELSWAQHPWTDTLIGLQWEEKNYHTAVSSLKLDSGHVWNGPLSVDSGLHFPQSAEPDGPSLGGSDVQMNSSRPALQTLRTDMNTGHGKHRSGLSLQGQGMLQRWNDTWQWLRGKMLLMK